MAIGTGDQDPGLGVNTAASGIAGTSGSLRGDNDQATRTRARTGCFNCRGRRRKCDESKPTCTGCRKRGEHCEWRVMGNFRESNMKALGPQHPSMKQAAGRKSSQRERFEILNVTPGVSRRNKRGITSVGRQAKAVSEGRASQIPRSAEDITTPKDILDNSSAVPAHGGPETQSPQPASETGAFGFYSSPNDGLLQSQAFSPSCVSPEFPGDAFSNIRPYIRDLSSQRQRQDGYISSNRNPDRVSGAARAYDNSAFRHDPITPSEGVNLTLIRRRF